MPFKSEAQRRKFYALKERGKMTQKKIDEWESKTPKNIPERVKKKSNKSSKTGAGRMDGRFSLAGGGGSFRELSEKLKKGR